MYMKNWNSSLYQKNIIYDIIKTVQKGRGLWLIEEKALKQQMK